MAINRIKYIDVESKREESDFVNFEEHSYVLATISITENGIYMPPEGIDGYNRIIVSTPVINNQDIEITNNGNYTPSIGYSGFGNVKVEVSDIPSVIEAITITATTSQQIINVESGLDGYAPITVNAVDSSIDNNIVSSNIVEGVSILGVNGSAIELNGTTTTITPTTSQQTITPTSPSNGFTEITVNAVDSSIDSNIQSSNIADGITILGVTGNAELLNGETINITPTTSQQTITPTSPKNGFTEITVDAVDNSIDSNIQSANIVSGVSILGVSGSAIVLSGETATVNPTTSQQTLTPTSGHNGFTEVTINAVTSAIDNNIVANNIKAGVSILGVQGSYEPTGTINISSEGTHDVGGYKYANVAIVQPYPLLSRVSDDNNNEIGTVCGYYTDGNGNKYAVIVLDAQYRLASGNIINSQSANITGLVVYSNCSVYECAETATFNTTKILEYSQSTGLLASGVTHCRNQSFVIGGITYYGQLPNLIELLDIYRNRTQINTLDTSAQSYSSLIIPVDTPVWSSTTQGQGSNWFIDLIGNVKYHANGNTRFYMNNNAFIAPILELPMS